MGASSSAVSKKTSHDSMGQKHGKSVRIPDRGESSSDEDQPDSASVSRKKNSQKKNKKQPAKMFRKQSDQAKKRLDHQMYLAEESPEPNFDISGCEMSEIPTSVFPLCKVLQKEVLLLHDNWLSHVHPAASVPELVTIRVLDLHNNEIKSLPSEISSLKNLQVLNLENNKMTKLPDHIGDLSCLQTLNIKGNRLKHLPVSICSMKSLRLLDISDNHITELPSRMCNVRTLETLMLDAADMNYPTSAICCSGTEEIMKFLCSETGLQYLPPSNFLLNVLDPPKVNINSPTNNALHDQEKLERNIEDYNAVLDKKRLERIEMERKFVEHQEEQAQLALMSRKNRDDLAKQIAEEDMKLNDELVKLEELRERNQRRLVRDLKMVEQGTDNLIASLLDMNAKAKKTEELLDAIEQERIKEDNLFVVKWEEAQNLRKKDVLEGMTKMLQENDLFEQLRLDFERKKETSMKQALDDDEIMTTAQVNSVLEHKDRELIYLIDDLTRQEQLQKEAFEALQLSKDTKHQRIKSQIALIQDELANLTVVEVDRRAMRVEEEMNRLCEKRIMLAGLLAQLMHEQDLRQGEIRKRMEEMEQQREDGQKDYWLIQFQRLMDKKPQSLIDQERQLEISVVKILNKSEAEDYLPVFARHRISIETMIQMSEDDLKQMGVHELGVRKNILRNIQEYLKDYVPVNGCAKMSWAPQPATTTQPATTPSPEEPGPAPTAPPVEPETPLDQNVTARGMNSECSICLDKVSDVIFMNCGHVCCCLDCSTKVEQCPLCRSDIVQRIRLLPSRPTGTTD